MKTNNKTIYSEDKNIVDTFIKVVKDKANFVIIKDDSEENIIIPANIREYINTVTFIYRESSLDSFKEYLMSEINSNLSKENVQFFNELNNTSNKVLNRKIINGLGVIYKDKLESSIDNLYSLTQATNSNNVSYGDLLSIIRFLEKTRFFSEKETPFFLTYLSNYYSIRISEALKNNLLNYNNSDFYYLINDQLTNRSIKYLPSERKGKPRDYFEIHKSPKKIFELISSLDIDGNNEELYFWLSSFFDRLGDNMNYVTSDDEIKSRTINRPGNPFESVTFNAISFLYNTLSPKNILQTYIPNTISDKVKKTDLYIEMEEWKNSLQPDNDYFQIFNIALFNKFINLMYKRAGTKDSLIHFDTYLYEYIVRGIPELIDDLNKDYNFDFGKLLNHPLLQYWSNETNKEKVSLVLRKVFEIPEKSLEKKKYPINKDAYSLVKKYKSNIINRINTKTVITNLITRLEEIPNTSPNYIDLIRDLRIKMDDSSRDSNDVKNELLNLIDNSIINNG
ncbi:hypothetical protein FG167_16545 [Lacinutrix sp. WUR7]|uniref:hypothetical protein n=1 Tax=Lacinutrix sp. WUR7 TaxID=2653681 RepID=UPI00193DBB0D|nr:hypothetical protein [Lacinutrix sp. WUR7]QRM90780.1 hypothetical protein FG167_16545 [Lacinutrix sp. WUR7]